MEPYSRTAIPLFFVCNTFVIAAVNVVLPWSMCPIVPTFTCGFVRSYFAFAIESPPALLPRSVALGGSAAGLGRDLLGNGRRHFFVAGKLHGGGGPTLGHRPEIGHVAEHLPEGDLGPDDFGGAPDLLRHDPSAPTVEVADHGPYIVARGDHLHVHDRLQQHGLGPPDGFLEGHRARDLEGDLAGIDLVIGPVREAHLDIDHRIPGQHAGIHRLPDALLHGRDVFAGDRAPHDLVLEGKALARRRFHFQVDVAVLAATRSEA